MADKLAAFGRVLVRRRSLDGADEETRFARCLSTLALTSIGVGSTLGAGVYVLAGEVAQKAGPAIVISFLMSAITSVLAGLCYAEFGARVGKTGSAYLYSYVTVGEIWAFITGWSLVLSYVIAAAAVAKGWASTFDHLVDGKIEAWFKANMPIKVSGGVLAEFPDFFVLILLLLLTALLAFGVKESALVNRVFTVVNLLVLTFSILCGFVKGTPGNWNLTLEDFQQQSANSSLTVEENFGSGGFAPFGLSGILSAAATCFFAFVGFDTIASMSEEAKNPRRSIPTAIMVTLLVCFVAYFGMSTALTFMMPYYLIDGQSPLPVAFEHVGWSWARYAVALGSLCALTTSLMGCMFPMPRVIYAMAQDGLLFRSLAKINGRTKTPLLATLVTGGVAALMGFLFDLGPLVDLSVIGTLWSYTLVAICVVILRYQPAENNVQAPEEGGEKKKEDEDEAVSLKLILFPSSQSPTRASGTVAYVATIAVSLLIAVLCAVLPEAPELPSAGAGVLSACVVLALLCLAGMALIWRQPQSGEAISFRVPLLPAVPMLSVLANVYLMVQLDRYTWTGFAIWMALGFAIYFLYGIRNSSEAGGGRGGSGNHTNSSSAAVGAKEPAESQSNKSPLKGNHLEGLGSVV